MRYSKYLTLLCMFTFLLPGMGLARTRNQGTMKLMEPARIGSTELQPGTYQVEWNGAGPQVEVNVMHHKNTVATTTGTLKTNDPAATQDAVVLQPAAGNSSVMQIAEIDFGSHKEALVITPSQRNRTQ
ncbi:MAG TPA: hypothetical protein VEF05_07545 [Terriglobales bacterium]|nr:hypothetical protein [Terriglobales bacterium]